MQAQRFSQYFSFFNLNKILTMTFLMILSSACAKFEVIAEPCEGDYLCVKGARISWPANQNVTFELSDTVPPLHRPYAEEAAVEYNEEVFEKFEIIIDASQTNAPAYHADHASLNRDGVNGIYTVPGAWPYEKSHPGSKAVTVTRYKNNVIREADIFLKSEEFTTQSSSDRWVKVLFLHEIGHALGRTHNDEHDSIMFPTLSIRHSIKPFNDNDFFAFDLAY